MRDSGVRILYPCEFISNRIHPRLRDRFKHIINRAVDEESAIERACSEREDDGLLLLVERGGAHNCDVFEFEKGVTEADEHKVKGGSLSLLAEEPLTQIRLIMNESPA